VRIENGFVIGHWSMEKDEGKTISVNRRYVQSPIRGQKQFVQIRVIRGPVFV